MVSSNLMYSFFFLNTYKSTFSAKINSSTSFEDILVVPQTIDFTTKINAQTLFPACVRIWRKQRASKRG